MFDFVVCTVWACLKGVTPYKAFKEESTNKNYFDDNYSAPFAMLAPSLCIDLPPTYVQYFLRNIL